MPYRSFSDPDLPTLGGGEFFSWYLLAEEIGELLQQIGNRLGGRVQGWRRVGGHDNRTGRDYFYDNLEIHRRRGGGGEPCFIGVYHYRQPEERRGSFVETWRTAHESAPSYARPLAEIIEEARAAHAQGKSGDWLDTLGETLRTSIGI